MIQYRIASGETLQLLPDQEGVEILGNILPDGLHVVLSWNDARQIARILNAMDVVNDAQHIR